jgi:hypothetical protein
MPRVWQRFGRKSRYYVSSATGCTAAAGALLGVTEADRERTGTMIALLALAAFIVLIEVAVVRGWVADSRDGRDWNVGNANPGRHGVVHPPAAWLD